MSKTKVFNLLVLLTLVTITSCTTTNNNPTNSPVPTISSSPTPTATPQATADPNQPILESPKANSTISSPLTLTGTVPPGWMFEGSFPISITDDQTKQIATGVGKEVTPGAWQLGDPIKFTATITYTTPAKSGFIVLKNDNPSGLPENDKSLIIPINFK